MARNDLIQYRRGTAAAWTTVNPVLADGEAGFESDTGRLKVGDGVAAWSALTYVSGDVATASWDSVMEKPTVIAAGDTQADARTAIGAASTTSVSDGDSTTLASATGRAIAFSIALG